MSNVIILAYANDNEASLKHLERESKTINDYLQFKNSGEINVRRLPEATYDDLLREFAAHKDNIILFHFSGHAGKAELFFNGENGARADGLAALLDLAPKIELAFLNGCGTKDQVNILHGKANTEKGVERVIATSRDVFDETAADFAIYFYSALCRYWSVGLAFDYAKAFVLAGKEFLLFPEGDARHIGTRLSKDTKQKDFPWGIYYKEITGKSGLDEYKSLDEFILPDKSAYIQEDEAYEPNSELIKGIGSKAIIIYDRLVELRDKNTDSTPCFDMEIEEFDELKTLYKNYSEGKVESITDLANRIVNMLPKPLGSLLRQMISESIDIKDKKKKNFENLLDLQLRFYTTMIKLCCYTMLSDLFNLIENQEAAPLKINKVQHKFLVDFFEITQKGKEAFDFVTFIKIIREILEENEAKPFVQEYLDLKEKDHYEDSFFDSHMLIRGIKLKRQEGKLDKSLVGYCQHIEKELINIFDTVYFILRYKLLVIKNVEAIRTRTVVTKTFKHRVIVLRQNITGLLEENELPPMEDYTETHSVIVVRGLYKIIEYLSLSPFVIDKNVLINDQNSELFFFSHIDKGLVFESIEDYSRIMEIEIVETKEPGSGNGKGQGVVTRTIIPYVEALKKKPFESARITNRLLLVKNQFTYIKNKISGIVPKSTEAPPPVSNKNILITTE